MTTEIAVINRLGVALATDSAVTISGGGKSKVFDTGDKLFELSEAESIGVMINGNMDLLGVPWEIIIKEFRHSRPCKQSRSMRDWMQCLLDFIAQHKTISEAAEREFITAIALDEFSKVKDAVRTEVLKRPEPDSAINIAELINEKALLRRKRYAKKSRAQSLEGVSQDDVRKLHASRLNRLITEAFSPVKIHLKERVTLRRLVIDALFAADPSAFSTGLIVAGYGDGDMFPSIAIAEVEGSVGGVVKYTHGEHVVIDRAKNPGRVISFAQTDVVDRILSGADNKFIDRSKAYITVALESTRDELVKLLEAAGLDSDAATDVFGDITRNIADGYKSEFVKAARADFQGDFHEMVALMPKQDIIELAEALVSITAIERKASSEQATVGGPIDVAFITKHEGFIWIKRKHYFQKDLNPRYFWRKEKALADAVSKPLVGEPNES